MYVIYGIDFLAVNNPPTLNWNNIAKPLINLYPQSHMQDETTLISKKQV